MAFKVFWCARDLDGVPVGNHQFILIQVDPIYGLPPFSIKEEKGVRFATLAAYNVGGNLEFRDNHPTDEQAVREFINPKKRGLLSDYDLEKHRVPSPLSSDQQFAETLVKQALAFKVKTQSKKIQYNLSDENCSTWINTMLKVAGVSLANRQKHGEFSGIDWGEEDLLDESYFQ